MNDNSIEFEPRVFISIISHGHNALIKDINCIGQLLNDFTVVLKSNISGETYFDYSQCSNFYHLNSNFGLGFGSNNNLVFNYCETKLAMGERDIFIILNPDVYVDKDVIFKLVNRMKKNRLDCATLNLYTDFEHEVSDDSLRNFPSFIDFVRSFLGLKNTYIIDKSKLKYQTSVDWASGAFLAFTCNHYRHLKGFDESYFMYCEDIDICYRSDIMGTPLQYFPDLKAVHLAKHSNRKILSRHFYWHLKSVFRFLLTKLGITRTKSRIKAR